MSEQIYNETASKLLVSVLAANTETEKVAAIDGLIRYIGRENLSLHDAKLFFATGESGSWMSSIMRLVKYSDSRRAAAEDRARRLCLRLAVVEAAMRRFRNILKDVSGSDTKDALLQMRISEVRLNDSDTPIDAKDTELMHLYQRLGNPDT